jgi:hypothetical protein
VTKARKKSTPVRAEDYSLGSPDFGKPAVSVRRPDYSLGSPDFGIAVAVERGIEQPGDSPTEQRALRFLLRFMREHPEPPDGMVKADIRLACERESGLNSIRAFDRLWERVISFTGAVAHKRSGPRRRR